MSFPQFILASASPARLQLLRNLGLEPVVEPSHFNEDSIQESDPTALVTALAMAKARTVALSTTLSSNPTVVLGCDSVLSIQGEIYGKPKDEAEAIARWQSMRGQWGELITGHALMDLNNERHILRSRSSRVHFANASDAEIQAYVATGEPLRCAGCFKLEGKGGSLVEKIEGCHSNIIGLSLPLLREMMAELGYCLSEAWL